MTRMSSGNMRIRVKTFNRRIENRLLRPTYEYLQVPDFAITCTFKVQYLTYPPQRLPGIYIGLFFFKAFSLFRHNFAEKGPRDLKMVY